MSFLLFLSLQFTGKGFLLPVRTRIVSGKQSQSTAGRLFIAGGSGLLLYVGCPAESGTPDMQQQTDTFGHEEPSGGGLGLLAADDAGADGQEEAFARELQRKKKKKRQRKI